MKKFKTILLCIIGVFVFTGALIFGMLKMDYIHLSSSHQAQDSDVEYQADSSAVAVDSAYSTPQEAEASINSEEPDMDDYLRFSETGDPLSAADLKKWVGKYQIKFIEDAGERPYDVIIDISIEPNGDTHLIINYQGKERYEIDEGYHVYGNCTKANSDNTKIEFLPQVISNGEDKGRDAGFFLEEVKGSYYLYNQMANPMKATETMAIPIIKLQ